MVFGVPLFQDSFFEMRPVPNRQKSARKEVMVDQESRHFSHVSIFLQGFVMFILKTWLAKNLIISNNP